MLSTVTNNGGPVRVKLGKKSHTIPQGRSEQSAEVLSHPLCVALITEKSCIIQPQGENRDGQWVQLRGYRLVVAAPVAAAPSLPPTQTVAELKPLIAESNSVEWLADLGETDSRITVKEAIEKRLIELQHAEDAQSEKDES